MHWRFWERHHDMDEGDRACLVHSQWLTEALDSNKSYPRIPTRQVLTGGFSKLLARSNGPELARRWWDAALSRVD